MSRLARHHTELTYLSVISTLLGAKGKKKHNQKKIHGRNSGPGFYHYYLPEEPLVMLARRPKLKEPMRSRSTTDRTRLTSFPPTHTHTHTRMNDSTGLFGLSFQAFIDGNGERDNGRKKKVRRRRGHIVRINVSKYTMRGKRQNGWR